MAGGPLKRKGLRSSQRETHDDVGDGSACNPQVPLKAFSERLLMSLPPGIELLSRAAGS